MEGGGEGGRVRGREGGRVRVERGREGGREEIRGELSCTACDTSMTTQLRFIL